MLLHRSTHPINTPAFQRKALIEGEEKKQVALNRMKTLRKNIDQKICIRPSLLLRGDVGPEGSR